MRRILAGGAVAVLAAVGVAGCGDDSDGSVSSRDQTSDQTRETTTTEAPSTAPDFVSLSKQAAIAKAEAEGRPWRISSENGESFPATLDYNPERVSFDINENRVTAANFG
jgi:hypothetical protein